MFKPKLVVLKILQAATHFETQLGRSTPFRNFPVIGLHIRCSCVCTIEDHNDEK